MSEPFKSQALEANLEQTRYKDIFIPDEHQQFINLSTKYFGINKRAKDCITEYHHPLSNHTFVVEELRKILMDDFWFYTRDDVPADAYLVPLEMMRSLLRPDVPKKLRLSIVNTLLEFVSVEDRRQKTGDRIIDAVFDILNERFDANRDCYILASKYAIRYLDKLACDEHYGAKAQGLVRMILKETYRYWRDTTMVEKWLDDKASLVEPLEAQAIRDSIGQPYFDMLNADLAIMHKGRPGHNKAEITALIGDVNGKICILNDDMIDTGGSVVAAVETLRNKGAADVYVCATHPVFSGPGLERMANLDAAEVVVCNTIPVPVEYQTGKIKVVSVAPLFARAIKSVFGNGSVSELFDPDFEL